MAQAVSRRFPTEAARVRSQVMWDLWWIKWRWGGFSSSTWVYNSTNCFTFISDPIIDAIQPQYR
jgi:hypothetical protein